MKKILICLLLAAMVISLVACKDNNTQSGEEDKGYTFTSGTTKIAIDDDVAPILAALGEWRDYDDRPSCGFPGIEKFYIYGGFEINTYPQGEKDFVYMIRLYDDTVVTEEGIRIGSTKEAVIEAYGSPDKQDETLLQYDTNKMFLQFLLTDGIVTTIYYWHPKAAES